MAKAPDTPPAKQPKTALAGPYGHPFHPIIVTVPIGAWVAALVFGVASRLVEDPEVFATGGRWLVAIGIIGALVAAVFGFLDFTTIPPSTPAQTTALIHMTLNLAVVAVFVLVWFLWPQGDPVGAVPLGLTVIALLALGASGWLGGKLTYTYGVRVADEGTQHGGYRPR